MFNDTITIKTQPKVDEAVMATFLTDAIIAVAFILLIIIVANLIAWEPGANDKSPAKRRRWFWIFEVCSLFTPLVVNFFNWGVHVSAKFSTQYTTKMIIASVVAAVIYGVVTYAICKMQKKDTKLASIFN